VWIASSLDRVLKPTIAALGNFDGVHQGHQQVIRPILPDQEFAQGSIQGIKTKVYSSVITFTPHPQEFFTGQPKALLTVLPEKAALLAALGVEQLILLPFNRELANLTPQEFVSDLLVDCLAVKAVSVGQDFCFGLQRSGTAQDLQTLAATKGVNVHITPLQFWQNQERFLPETVLEDEPEQPCLQNLQQQRIQHFDQRISSSAIRKALLTGEVAFAQQLLGRPYSLEGLVVSGQQLGRTLGFPTANLQVHAHKFLPRSGVYAVQVEILPVEGQPLYLPAVLNIGQRPTVQGREQTIEVHLLDWSGHLYDRTLRVHFHHFLRSEQKFNALEQLKAQIQADCDIAAELLAGRGVSGARVETMAAKTSLPSTGKGKW
jgi:riboflavin kinase/FMN adenylyltransferase